MKKFILGVVCTILMLLAIPCGESCSATILKGDPVLVVEEPTVGKSYVNEFTISGYALNNSRVKEVNAYIDGELKESCTTGIRRDDRYELLKEYIFIYPEILHCGFSTNLNLQNVDLGLHTLKVEAVGRDNTKADTSLYIYVYEDETGSKIAQVITDRACESIPFYRYWKKGSNEHFYTISLEEGNNKINYLNEDLTCYGYPIQVEGTVPVYRFYRYSDKSYIYTSNEEEALSYRSDTSTFRNDGVQMYINKNESEGLVPLYRYVKNDSETHENAIYFYTFNWNELGSDNGEYYFKEIVGYVKTNA